MTSVHGGVKGALFLVLVVLSVAVVSGDVRGVIPSSAPLNSVVFVGAVLLGVESLVRPDRLRVATVGGVLLVLTGAYALVRIATVGTVPLSNPVVSAAAVLGALASVVTRERVQSLGIDD